MTSAMTSGVTLAATALVLIACTSNAADPAPTTTGQATSPTAIQFRSVLQTLDPPGVGSTPTVGSGDALPGTHPGERYIVGPPLTDGSIIESTRATLDQTGQWTVQLVMRPGPDGIDRLNAAAKPCHDQVSVCPFGQLALVVDGVVVTAPRIEPDQQGFTPFARDQIQISGGYDEASAKALATRLHS